MHIVVFCPECQSRYQLHSDLNGRRMRCPNPSCRTTFTVKSAGDAGPVADPDQTVMGPRRATLVPSPGPRVTNALGELVPMRKGGRPEDGPTVMRTDAPEEVLDWRNAPPPVQAPGERPVLGEPARAPLPTFAADDEVPPAYDAAPRRRRSAWVIVALGLLTAGMIAGGGWWVVTAISQSEDRLRAEAEADYKIGKYGPAGEKYKALADKFGRSARAAEYRLLADLSDLRDAAGSGSDATSDAARAFVEKFSRDPILEPYRDDLASALIAIGVEIAQRADRLLGSGDWAKVEDLLKRGQQALSLIDRYPPRDGTSADLRKQFDRIRTDLSARRLRRAKVDEVVTLLKPPKPDLAAADRLARAADLGNDPEVTAAIEAARRALGALVQYVPRNRQPLTVAPPDGPPSILLEPYSTPPRPGAGDVVLAVARGLLYALDARDGRRLWAARVGPDADTLPVRLPGRGDEAELVLVAVSDPPALTARDLRTGVVRWHQPLDAPPLGRPVFDGINRLYVPAAGDRGLVYDLDARAGILIGQFETGQPLAGGAALDRTLGRLYVPAYGHNVYVFNFHPEGNGPPRREGLLPTGHAPGSLRGEPIVVSGEEGIDVSRYLVLGEAHGLDAMKLRAFRLLPTADAFANPPAEVRVAGWSWFPPYADSEKIALVTDAGALGLFGIQQAGNPADRPLFPLLGVDPPTAEEARRPLRAQLIHAEEYGFWVLAGGVLQHYRLGLDRAKGRILAPMWGNGPRLGSPLHGGQVNADRSTLYLVTQTPAPAACLATAVDARSGRVLWQRPLGLSCQGDPLPLGDGVVALDPSGAVYRFDPPSQANGAAATWQTGGTLAAKPIPDLVGTPLLLSAGDAAYVFACRRVEDKYRIVIRRVPAAGEVTEKVMVPLDSPPAGPPALGPDALVVPLANGLLCRLPLDGEATRWELGPNWRALGAKPDAPGFVTHWHGDEYLFTDGTRRLVRISWPAGKPYELGREASLDLRQRLSAPVRLPARGDEPRAVVADAGGTLTLVTGAVPKVARTWRVGAITAGPWAVGDRVAAVVDRTKLVWIDPEKDAPAWTADVPGDGVEARPLLADGRLIVADVAGLFLALDPATGKAVGDGYRHPAVVAPAAAVVAFGAGRLFAPLTDGSALVLPAAELTRVAGP